MFDTLKCFITCLRKEKAENNLQLFDTVQQSEQAYESIHRGVREIPLLQIVGTVGRYHDFDNQFRPKREGENSRLDGIRRAMVKGRLMPPVSLYQIKEDYFILDGHHRVAAARELGHTHIRACIVELLPGADSLENRLYLEKISFRDKSGQTETLELTEPGQFVHLEKQIQDHQQFLKDHEAQDFTFKQAAADWSRTIYRPLKAMIEKSGLVHSFPGRTVDDLYLYISTYQWEKGAARNYGIGIDRLIPQNMEAFRELMIDRTEAQYPDMKREITFFVLMNVEGRYEDQIMDKLYAQPEVDEIHSVHGSIDMVVKVTLQRDLLASDAELISEFTQRAMRTLKGVRSTQTLIPGVSKIKQNT
ncbi:Lrp/AsnC ligand binding domain-containing protein [Desulfogranum japonicum]|uniref:Lrp/AsnC ligand binding domain-containing protein n=1 Tax=Desulfogranum japonicum TaxID=231447 RepID=UPI0003FD5AF0|nr:Lrp/AsnC ligand binding domain-containing protein [Desulfogranum japonicum]